MSSEQTEWLSQKFKVKMCYFMLVETRWMRNSPRISRSHLSTFFRHGAAQLQHNLMYAPKKSSFMFIYVDTAESIIALLLTIIVIVIGRMMRIAAQRAELLSAREWSVQLLQTHSSWHFEWVVMCGAGEGTLNENESKDWRDIYKRRLTFHDLSRKTSTSRVRVSKTTATMSGRRVELRRNYSIKSS